MPIKLLNLFNVATLFNYVLRHTSEGKFVNFALLNSPQRMFYLIFYHDQNLRFCLPVSSDYLLFVLGEKEKYLS